jgi:hypothetical protein
MTSLNTSSISPTGGVQDRPALSFIERCAIADREIGYVVEKIVAVRDMLNREDNPTGRELIQQTLETLGNTLHDLRGRQTILRNIHPVLKQKMAEIE